MFDFRDFLIRSQLEPGRVKLLRHNEIGTAHWARGRDAFGCFASFQRRDRTPYGAGYQFACHFIAGPSNGAAPHTALFVGATRIVERWNWERQGERLPTIREDRVIADYRANEQPHEAFDLEWIDDVSEYAERLLIRWIGGPINWHQSADLQGREILELRLMPQEPPFPGFALFSGRVRNIPLLPPSWQAALASVGGVYLLVADNGHQYVGSASGLRGFIGRWEAYARNGHGGNRWLEAAGHKDYVVSILEVASPDMSARDIILREFRWMDKLGTRDHGLNHGQDIEARLREIEKK